MRILSIDDAHFIRLKIAQIVAEMNQEFLEAENGEAALSLLQQQGPVDLILLDYNMPVMDGMQTLKRLKSDERYKAIPVIMVTTEVERMKIVEALSNGACDYLMKPFENDDLMTKIARFVQKS